MLRRALYFAIASIPATIIGAIAGLADLGEIVYILDWPNVLVFGTKFYLQDARAFVVNAAGWALVGAVSAARFRKKDVARRR